MLSLFRKLSPRNLARVAAALMVAVYTSPAFASGASDGSMPYDTALQTILDSVTGPVAKVAGAIAIAITGLGVAFSEGGSMVKKGVGVVFGLSIAFNAVSWGLPLFGFSGGAGF